MFVQHQLSGGGKKRLEIVYRKTFLNYHMLLLLLLSIILVSIIHGA